jgi:hypothetical protein
MTAVKLSGVAIRPLDDALRFLEDEAATILPKGYVIDYTGESRQLRAEGNKFGPAFLLSIVLIFLILAAQFNSFRDPFVILMGSVPLAMFGSLALTFLKMPNPNRPFWTDGWTTTLNVYSQVGLVTLVGLVAKNGILIVQFANELQRARTIRRLPAGIGTPRLSSAKPSRGLPVAITRCGNFYGGGDLNWTRIVPGTIRSVLRGLRPVIRSDGNYVRDYFYVEDGAAAYMLLAEAMAADRGLAGQAFNFSNGIQVTVLELVRRILATMNSTLEPDVRNGASHEIRRQYLSADKARRMLQWSPLFDLDGGLAHTIGWYSSFFAQSAPSGEDV